MLTTASRLPQPRRLLACLAGVLLLAAAATNVRAEVPAPTAQEAAEWHLADKIPMPKDNESTPERAELGKALFFDPRLSGSQTMSCASCHQPTLGWADGHKTAVLLTGEVLGRASPTMLNLAYNTQFMWDGRKKSLEDQAEGPHKHLSTDAYKAAAAKLGAIPGYREMFDKAYPGEPIDVATISKALAAFERTLVSRDSPFDQWLAGDRQALTEAQYRGYKLFADPAKANCAACHSGSNFTDNGYHNIGLRSKDVGRYAFRKVASLKGAFKTPTLRDIERTAPYFHDGSALTLREVVDHYARGGDDKSNLSPDVHTLNLSEQDKDDLVAFLRSLSGKPVAFTAPKLPQ